MVSLTASSARINQTRFEELFSEHQAAVRRYVWSLKVEPNAIDDIMQETAIALWRKFDSYDSTRSFAPWACRFAFLQVLKHRQRACRDRHIFDDDKIHSIRDDWNRDSEVSVARRRALHSSLTLLTESERQLLQCRYDSKETIQSMAKRRATSVHKLYHSLDNIRETLRMTIDQFMMAEGWERDELT